MSLLQQLRAIKSSAAFWLFILLLSSITAAQNMGLLQPLNALTYLLFNQKNNQQQSNVVLIESAQLAAHHTQLINKITDAKPRAIVVFAHQAALSNNVQQDIFYNGFSNQPCRAPITNWLGYSIVYQRTLSPCQSWLNTLFPDVHYGSYIIDFTLPVASLPKFSSTRVLSGDTFATQFTNKIVFIAPQPHEYQHALKAPGLSSLTNPVYLYAYLVHNLDKQLLVKPMTNMMSTLIQLSVLITLLLIYQKYSLKFNVKLACFFCLVWLSAGYITVHYFQILLPSAQLILHTWLAFVWVYFYIKWREEGHLTKLVTDVEQRMFGRYLPKSIIESDSPWDAIIKLTLQQLSLEKSIFLSRIEGDHRLEELHAVNCHLSDIKELRRDYERSPYSDAIKELGVIVISRPFFSDIQSHEVQYIAPLMYAGDIRGFWALTIVQDEQFNEAAFKRNVNRFANQIGELLYHYRMFKHPKSSPKTNLNTCSDI